MNNTNQPDPKKKQSEEMEFCTECGEALENFAFEGDAVDIEKLKQNRERCKQTGKAKGHHCAKLFIAESFDPDLLKDDE
jgi:hypothetical protein